MISCHYVNKNVQIYISNLDLYTKNEKFGEITCKYKRVEKLVELMMKLRFT